MDVYVPSRYVSQEDLEIQDGCVGKYTKGLGQLNMAFVDDREDIASIYMSAVSSLLEKYNIDVQDIGRLEVGTETLIDKSKSVKTSLMGLMGCNTDLEGVTSVNACYGGTAALFNSIAWIESSEWDGRYALVVCGDIAVYDEGPARPTGGCGAVAMLIGPDAPLALEPGVRASHAMDLYDFYKPLHSEYALVDGKLSQWAYLTSVDTCYERYKAKTAARFPDRKQVSCDYFDFFCFHSPYNKLVQKGFNRIVATDFFDEPNNDQFSTQVQLQSFKDVPKKDTYESRDFDMALRQVSSAVFEAKVVPTCTVNQNIGNCYTGSVFTSLASLVCGHGAGLVDKRVFMFSYGSGSVASIYSFVGREPTSSSPRTPLGTLASIANTMDIQTRLDARTRASVEEFSDALKLRAAKYGQAPMSPDGPLAALAPGTYYLTGVNDNHHRTYARVPSNSQGTKSI